MKTLIASIVIAVFVLLSSATTFAHMMGHGMKGMKGMMNMSMVRHHYVMRNGIGPEYSSIENSVESNEENLQAGKLLYEQNCLRCHGSSGYGDGPDGKELNQRPANIANFSKMHMATDGYLFWTIAEGGVPVNTEMPAYKDALKEKEIWKIINYLRSM